MFILSAFHAPFTGKVYPKFAHMELFWQIALTKVDGVGPIVAKKLLQHCGSASHVFKAGKGKLLKIPEVGNYTANSIQNFNDFKKIEEEIRFIEDQKIRIYFYADKEYPFRLKNNEDCPILLYQRGDCDLNSDKILGIVGTRKPTEYGLMFCEKLLSQLKGHGITTVSGMAYGIDVCAHKHSLMNQIPTIGVFAHGLDRVYPSLHRKYVDRILENKGGFVTEFLSGTNPERENFPKRNRIVAGLCDALIVIETAKRGGSMITSELAWQYDRCLFAVPGRYNDPKSEGCNFLIKTNRASLLEQPEDLLKSMLWNKTDTNKLFQKTLPIDLPPEVQLILQLFEKNKVYEIDALMKDSELSGSKIALSLLDLEFRGHIRTLPGKRYQRI